MPASDVGVRTPSTVIEPRRGWFHLGLNEVWRYRELAYFLVWRDLKVRYKQTVIGAAWAVLQPVVLMVIFVLIFGRGGGRLRPPPEIPGPIFYFSALLPWTYFSHSLAASASSVLGAQQIIKKIYFERMILPVYATLPGLIDFVMAFAVLIGLMVFYSVPFTLNLLALPLLLLIACLTAFGAGTWLSATNALYRDVREAIPFIIQVLLFTSPVILQRSAIPEWFQPFYALNPIAGVIEGSRWAVTGVGQFPWDYILIGLASTLVLVVTGVMYFRRIEDIIVDVV